jgi:hypothetical protein
MERHELSRTTADAGHLYFACQGSLSTQTRKLASVMSSSTLHPQLVSGRVEAVPAGLLSSTAGSYSLAGTDGETRSPNESLYRQRTATRGDEAMPLAKRNPFLE